MAVSALSTVPVTEAAYGTVETVSEAPLGPVEQEKKITRTKTVGIDPKVETAVRSYFKDIPVMAEIARCESTFRHTLPDGSVLRGKVDNRDTGVMQINTGYHAETAVQLGLNLYNLNDNMAYARYLYEKKGTQPWNASRPCWGKHGAELAVR
jgi:hypothetical protein